jgi:FtsH-binding integral membrane protein
MIVKMNGRFLMEIGNVSPIVNDEEIVIVKKGFNKNLKTIAVTLWTLAGSLIAKSIAFAEGTSFYEQIQPLYFLFQDFALALGSLALIAGLVLLVFKKRMGQQAVKTTAIIIGGVFLAPSLIMLVAIVATYLNDALYEALKNVRDMNDARKVMKGE